MAKISTLQFVRHAEAGADMLVMDPTAPERRLLGADGEPAAITLLGMDSNVAKRHQQIRAAESQSRLYASAFTKAEDKADDRAESPLSVTVDDIAAQEARELDLLAALTVAWRGFEDDDGHPLVCTPLTVRALYEQCPPIRAQVVAFVNRRAHFFDASATPSAPSLSTASA